MSYEYKGINPATGLMMTGDTDSEGNYYGCGSPPSYLRKIKENENKNKKPCTENDVANYVVWAVYIGFILFSLVLIGRHLN